jgi:hypothetical protein
MEDVLNLKDQERWNDTEFGPSNADPMGLNSLFKNPHKKPEGFYKIETNFVYLLDFPDIKLISWRRIDEIVGFPIFTERNAAFESPIMQGEIGDSWFLGALLLLSSQKNLIFGEDQELFSGIYPKFFHFLSYFGNFFEQNINIIKIIRNLRVQVL